MRILQVSKWYLPYTGGIELTVHQIAKGLKHNSLAVRVLTCHRYFSTRSKREQLDGIDVIRANSFGNPFSTPASPTFPFRYIPHARWADVVHFHLPFPLAATFFSLVDLRGKKVVVTFHADPANTRWAALSQFYRPVLNRLLRRADAIVVTSPALRDKSPSLQQYQDKSHVIPLATRLTAAPQDRLPGSNGHHSGEQTVLAVGRMVYYKGFQYLLEAMVNVNARLLLVGEGQELENLKVRARKLGIAERVQFCGYVSDEELKRHYSAADVFVLPSISPAEAFGIVQVEAMANGLPVVNTHLPTGVPFVSEHGNTGLTVPPKDSDELAGAINRILQDDALRMEMGANAQKRAERFSVENMLQSYYSLYLDLQAASA